MPVMRFLHFFSGRLNALSFFFGILTTVHEKKQSRVGLILVIVGNSRNTLRILSMHFNPLTVFFTVGAQIHLKNKVFWIEFLQLQRFYKFIF